MRDDKQTGGANITAPPLYGWCGGEGMGMTKTSGIENERNRKDERVPLSRRDIKCPTKSHRCRINAGTANPARVCLLKIKRELMPMM
jgi:hypothetical protein